MEYRQLGTSGLRVSTVTLGTMTFGGRGWAAAVGDVDVDGARRQISMALDAGVNLIDTAEVYSEGLSEEIVAKALPVARDEVLLATKVRMPMGEGPNDAGLSRHHIIRGCEASLRRLGTDYIDLYQVHEWDGQTPLDETLQALDDLVSAGKVRYIGASNYAGWQLMKSLAAADRLGLQRYVANQTYYSLIGRDYEWELMPLGLDQGVGAIVWSPLGWGRLTGKVRRGQPLPASSRLHETAGFAPPVADEHVYRVVDAMDEVAAETGKTLPQIAINWLLSRPTVASVLIGARDEAQLKQNLGALGWQLSADQRAKLDAAGAVTPPYPYYPYWNGQFAERSPAPV
jgi:aryl-alcohol dehydrogenase-like predicted oxidoreductase